MEPLTQEQYQRLRAAGYSDEEIRADGYELPTVQPVAPQAPPPTASDATRARTVRRSTPETEPDPYGLARTAVNALTAGTSPTIRGITHAVGSVLPGGRSPGQAYREEKDAEVAALRNFLLREPRQALGVNLTASLPLALAGGAAAAPYFAAEKLSRPARVARTLGTGAAVGGGAGFLAGAGGAPGDLPAQLQAGIRQILPGAGIGLGASGVAAGLGATARKATGTAHALGGRPSPAQLTEASDKLITEGLESTGQNIDDVVRRATRIEESGLPRPTVGEAMGPAGQRIAQRMGPLESRVGGEAYTAGTEMLEQAGQRATSPEVTRLYDEALAVGPVQLPPRGQNALLFLKQKFPKLNDDLQRYIEDKGIPWDRMVDEQGDFTVEYYDLLKKYVDSQIYGKGVSRAAKDAAWLRMNRADIEGARGQLVDAVDDAVRAKTGASPYRDARRVAEGDIGTQKELRATRESFGKELQRASGRIQPEGLVEEAAAVAAFGAQRPKIGFTQALIDPLKGGIRRTARRQAGVTLESLLSDPDALSRALAERALERQLLQGRRLGFRGITAPLITSQATRRP
ncbi:MAG: hypothetical protein L0191_07915 [Acidobacteria bacterium]|nr:hypothetical protein [Acidobacteriota bacterium]